MFGTPLRSQVACYVAADLSVALAAAAASGWRAEGCEPTLVGLPLQSAVNSSVCPAALRPHSNCGDVMISSVIRSECAPASGSYCLACASYRIGAPLRRSAQTIDHMHACARA